MDIRAGLRRAYYFATVTEIFWPNNKKKFTTLVKQIEAGNTQEAKKMLDELHVSRFGAADSEGKDYKHSNTSLIDVSYGFYASRIMDELTVAVLGAGSQDCFEMACEKLKTFQAYVPTGRHIHPTGFAHGYYERIPAITYLLEEGDEEKALYLAQHPGLKIDMIEDDTSGYLNKGEVNEILNLAKEKGMNGVSAAILRKIEAIQREVANDTGRKANAFEALS